MIRRYATLLGNRRFLGYVATGGFFYAGTFAYIAGSPFAYINHHHVSPQWYGLLFAAGIAGLMVTNQLNARLLNRYHGDRVLLAGGVLSAFAGLVLALNTWSDWGGLPLMVFACFLFVAATGFVLAKSIAGALNSFPQFSGSASALAGALQYGSGIAGSALVAAFADGSAWPMGTVMALCGMGCALSALWVGRQPEA